MDSLKYLQPWQRRMVEKEIAALLAKIAWLEGRAPLPQEVTGDDT